ncbi:MAG TPA: hypothetical protein VM266_06700 [Solirubrobacteraceae bacterium]|nr:hypothetical protein [Solirubrobacteraceae bacterium]
MPIPATKTAAPERPAATRPAVLAAFRAAAHPPAPAAAALPAPAIAPPAPLAAAPPPHVSPAPISRLRSDAPVAGSRERPEPREAEKPLDLDAIADHVLERLRGELRDGRERLGFLLDDSH